MAFPTVRSSNADIEELNATSHPIILPPTIESGDLILVAYTVDSVSSVVITWGTDFGTWTQLADANTHTTVVRTEIRYLIADGTEDGVTLTNTTDESQTISYCCYAIQDWEGTASGIEISSEASTTGTAPDPSSITASWGTADTLFIAFEGHDDLVDTTVFPYADNNIKGKGITTSGVGSAMCSDELTGATQDPGAFTLSASQRPNQVIGP